MKKIPVMFWDTEDSGESPVCWRMDEDGEGDRFFGQLIDNAEMDGRDRFFVKYLSEKEWKEIEEHEL